MDYLSRYNRSIDTMQNDKRGVILLKLIIKHYIAQRCNSFRDENFRQWVDLRTKCCLTCTDMLGTIKYKSIYSGVFILPNSVRGIILEDYSRSLDLPFTNVIDMDRYIKRRGISSLEQLKECCYDVFPTSLESLSITADIAQFPSCTLLERSTGDDPRNSLISSLRVLKFNSSDEGKIITLSDLSHLTNLRRLDLISEITEIPILPKGLESLSVLLDSNVEHIKRIRKSRLRKVKLTGFIETHHLKAILRSKTIDKIFIELNEDLEVELPRRIKYLGLSSGIGRSLESISPKRYIKYLDLANYHSLSKDILKGFTSVTHLSIRKQDNFKLPKSLKQLRITNMLGPIDNLKTRGPFIHFRKVFNGKKMHYVCDIDDPVPEQYFESAGHNTRKRFNTTEGPREGLSIRILENQEAGTIHLTYKGEKSYHLKIGFRYSLEVCEGCTDMIPYDGRECDCDDDTESEFIDYTDYVTISGTLSKTNYIVIQPSNEEDYVKRIDILELRRL